MSSDDSTCPAFGPVSDAEISVWKTAFYQVASSFVLWGIHISLVCHAMYLLWKRGLSNSLSRQCLSALVLIMLASNTANSIIGMEFYIIQLPWFGLESPPADVIHQLKAYNLGTNWLARLNFSLSDIIVVWRAWALWPGNRPIRWTLAFFMGGTLACTTANVVLITVQHFQTPNPTSPGHLYPASALRSLLYIPLLATNVLATTLICYKAWLYRKDIRTFANMRGSSKASVSSSNSPVRVDRVFALFIETGALYVIFFILMMLGSFAIYDGTDQGNEFFSVWGQIMNATSAIYPTIIIILVSKYMSQSDVVYSVHSAKHSNPSPGSPKPDGLDGNAGVLSTIRFDMPRMPTTMSSESTYEEENLEAVHRSEHGGEKRTGSESV